MALLSMRNTTEQLGLLRTALDEHSASDVQSLAHLCKGGSNACGATTLASLFQELERLGHEGQLEQAQQLDADVEHEFARVQAFLKDLHVQQAAP